MNAISDLGISTSDELHRLFSLQRSASRLQLNPDAALRIDRLKRIIRMTEQHGEAIVSAISQDFGNRARAEAYIAELLPVINGARHNIKHVRRWMKPRKVPVALQLQPGRASLTPQPLGVVGIVAPWNYPFQLILLPVIGAFAAGNRVMVKPSELLPTYCELLKKIVAEFFSEEEFTVITGDAETGKEFTTLPFDHLIFTGSTAVGRIVAEAAGKNLTPLTLELGGKSPVIVDTSANLQRAAEKIVWGKLFNAGQTCIAPDYALVPRAKIPQFVEAMRASAKKMYPAISGNPDYTSIVSQRHYARLQGLLQDAAGQGARLITVPAGDAALAKKERKIALTLVLGGTDQMQIMRDEIFGPLLPVIAYDSLQQAVAYVNARDRPLALYWFGEDTANRDAVLANTISGGVTINDCLVHAALEELPFGGVGPAGMGAYHGECGFRHLSHDKPVFYQSRFSGMRMMYPPYGEKFNRVLNLIRKYL